MPNVLATGSAWLTTMLHDHASDTVTYRRGQQSIEVSAVIGGSPETQVDANGLITQIRNRDFLVKKVALNFGSGPVAPQAGDRIEMTVGGSTETWQVQPTNGDRGYRDTDALELEWRIHCKRVA